MINLSYNPQNLMQNSKLKTAIQNTIKLVPTTQSGQTVWIANTRRLGTNDRSTLVVNLYQTCKELGIPIDMSNELGDIYIPNMKNINFVNEDYAQIALDNVQKAVYSTLENICQTLNIK